MYPHIYPKEICHHEYNQLQNLLTSKLFKLNSSTVNPSKSSVKFITFGYENLRTPFESLVLYGRKILVP